MLRALYNTSLVAQNLSQPAYAPNCLLTAQMALGSVRAQGRQSLPVQWSCSLGCLCWVTSHTVWHWSSELGQAEV